MIINLTSKEATELQKKLGVVDPLEDSQKYAIRRNLYLLDTHGEIFERIEDSVENLAKIANDIANDMALPKGETEADNPNPREYVLIDGPAFITSTLERELFQTGLWPVYWFDGKIIEAIAPEKAGYVITKR